jgi:hypothetical protein
MTSTMADVASTAADARVFQSYNAKARPRSPLAAVR